MNTHVSSPSISPRLLTKLQAGLRPAELEVIWMMDRVRIATRRQIEAALFMSPRSCQRALKHLADEEWLERLNRPHGGSPPGKRGGGGSDEHTYILGRYGIALARAKAPNIGRSSKPFDLAPPYIPHALLVTDVFVELRRLEQINVLSILRFEVEPACWRPLPGEASKLKSDAFTQVRLEVGGKAFTGSFFLEADRDTEHQTELRQKLRAYVRYVLSREWRTGQDRLKRPQRVLILVPSQSRQAELVRLIKELPESTQRLFDVALHQEAGVKIASVPDGAPTPATATERV